MGSQCITEPFADIQDRSHASPSDQCQFPPPTKGLPTERMHRFRNFAGVNGQGLDVADRKWGISHICQSDMPSTHEPSMSDVQSMRDESELERAAHECAARSMARRPTPHFDAEAHTGESTTSMSNLGMHGDANKDVSLSDDCPGLLSYYRTKCLELASQVQKTDTEV